MRTDLFKTLAQHLFRIVLPRLFGTDKTDGIPKPNDSRSRRKTDIGPALFSIQRSRLTCKRKNTVHVYLHGTLPGLHSFDPAASIEMPRGLPVIEVIEKDRRRAVDGKA